jgi:methylenetetrahydrofolate reductase (NADPH)
MAYEDRVISFEFFPPKTVKGQQNLCDTAGQLAEQKPGFFSVTYGAGGTTREGTIDTVRQLRERTGIPTAPHLACVGETASHLRELLQGYRTDGVDRIVALRGDLPSGMGLSQSEFRYACQLVEFIRAETGDHFHIEVAAYPEYHPQAESPDDDFRHFVTKVKAGASSAITQYFYNADSYFAFVDRLADAGLDIPVIPGIMPITNYHKLVRFSDACGAELPRWIRQRLKGFQDDVSGIQAFGEDVVTDLCERLLRGGAPGLHFYTLNQAGPSLKLCERLGLDKPLLA